MFQFFGHTICIVNSISLTQLLDQVRLIHHRLTRIGIITTRMGILLGWIGFLSHSCYGYGHCRDGGNHFDIWQPQTPTLGIKACTLIPDSVRPSFMKAKVVQRPPHLLCVEQRKTVDHGQSSYVTTAAKGAMKPSHAWCGFIPSPLIEDVI